MRDLSESSFSSPGFAGAEALQWSFGSFVDGKVTSIKVRIHFPNLVSISCVLCCGNP